MTGFMELSSWLLGPLGWVAVGWFLAGVLVASLNAIWHRPECDGCNRFVPKDELIEGEAGHFCQKCLGYPSRGPFLCEPVERWD